MEEINISKFTRWIIPGWVFFLFLLVFWGCDLLLQGNNLITIINSSAMTKINFDTESEKIIATSLLAVSGVPVGFIIYQIYFFFRWNSPFSSNGGPLPLIDGRVYEIEKIKEGVDIDKIKKLVKWKKDLFDKEDVDLELRVKWNLLDIMFLESALPIDANEGYYYRRYRYLHQITHLLGACIASAVLSFVIYTTGKYFGDASYSLTSNINISSILHSQFLVVILFFLLREEQRKKFKKFSDKVFFKKHLNDNVIKMFHGKLKEIPVYIIPISKKKFFSISQPSSLMLYLVFVVHILFNPKFQKAYNQQSFVAWAIASLLISFMIWVLPKMKTKLINGVFGDVVLALLLSVLLALIDFHMSNSSHNAWLTYLNPDWPHFTCTCIFLFTVYCLFKNQGNARNEMLMLQNYVLRKSTEEFFQKQHK
jgi:hypothetical protein